MLPLPKDVPVAFEPVLRIQTVLIAVTWPLTMLSDRPLLTPALPLRSHETCGELPNFSESQFLTCKISIMMPTSQGQGKELLRELSAGQARHIT